MTYLVEWRDNAVEGLECADRGVASTNATSAMASALTAVDDAETSRIRMTLLFRGANHAAVNAGRAELEAWRATFAELPPRGGF